MRRPSPFAGLIARYGRKGHDTASEAMFLPCKCGDSSTACNTPTVRYPITLGRARSSIAGVSPITKPYARQSHAPQICSYVPSSTESGHPGGLSTPGGLFLDSRFRGNDASSLLAVKTYLWKQALPGTTVISRLCLNTVPRQSPGTRKTIWHGSVAILVPQVTFFLLGFGIQTARQISLVFRAYPNNGCTCHVEPFDYAQDKLRETSLFNVKCEILRFAQNDNPVGCGYSDRHT